MQTDVSSFKHNKKCHVTFIHYVVNATPITFIITSVCKTFLVKLIGPLVSLLWYDLCAYKIYKDDNNRFCRYQYQLPLGQPNHTCGGANV